MVPIRLWYLRRGVPWAAVTGCLAVAVVLAAAAWHWPTRAGVLLPFVVASGAAAAGFLLDEDATVLAAPTPRGGRWADVSRLSAVPVLGLVVAALVRPGTRAADLTAVGWTVVSCVAVAVGVATARVLRGRLLSPGTHVAALVVLATALPFTVGALLGLTPPWPGRELSGGIAVLWVVLGLAAALVLLAPLLRPGPRARSRSASMHA